MNHPHPSTPRLILLNAAVALTGVLALLGYSWLLVYQPAAARQLTAVIVINANIALILLHPIAGFLAWLLLAPYAPFLPFDINMPAGVPDLAFVRTVGGFLALYLLARVARRRQQLFALSPVEFAIPFFALALLLAALRSNLGWVTATQLAFDSYLTPLLAYFIARQLIDTPQRLRQMTNALLLAATIMAAMAISEQLWGVTLFRNTGTQDFYSAAGVRKVGALLGNPAYIALAIAVVMPLALARALETKRPRRRGVYLLLILLLAAGVYLTYNRSGWMAGALALLPLLLLAPRLRRPTLLTLLLAGGLLIASWNAIESTPVGQRLTAESPIDYRVGALETGLTILRSNPILGVGYASFGRIAARMGLRGTGHVFVLPTPHNSYLHLAVSGGLVLLASYLLLAAALAVTLIGLARRFRAGGEASPFYLLAGWACLLAYFAASAGFDNNFAIYANILFWSIMGGILSAAQGQSARSLPSSISSHA
ncbi:MAG: O-antigen ligase family protein [Caldilineales bacterium]|nr:O-antigen ligase family protein [Caldilineales bacterium]